MISSWLIDTRNSDNRNRNFTTQFDCTTVKQLHSGRRLNMSSTTSEQPHSSDKIRRGGMWKGDVSANATKCHFLALSEFTSMTVSTFLQMHRRRHQIDMCVHAYYLIDTHLADVIHVLVLMRATCTRQDGNNEPTQELHSPSRRKTIKSLTPAATDI